MSEERIVESSNAAAGVAKIMELAASGLGIALTEQERAAFPVLIADMLKGLDALDALEGRAAPPQRVWHKPRREEDPFNAFACRTDVGGSAEGLLAGRNVALKDTISLAGVPLGNGSHLLDGFVPREDAEIVPRLLSAGARIVGKTNCECLCASGASFTGIAGPVLNPYDPSRSAGGSSSGSAVAVATGAADMAIGGDQGGSIRVPAALCGIVGLKPTFGVVPYSGIAGVDPALDHAGPMTRTVRDAALLLSVIAGPDATDPRQHVLRPDFGAACVDACDQPAAGLRIGLVPEGFAAARPGVASMVHAALDKLTTAGAAVIETPVAMHTRGTEIWMPVILLGTLTGMRLDGGGLGLLRDDMADMVAHLADWATRAGGLSDILRLLLLTGEVERRRAGLRRYGIGHRLGRQLAAAYDKALENVDVLAMPTVPATADLLPAPDATLADRLALAVGTVTNTAPFNLTGHPAITVPCGLLDGLPVGLMLIARRDGEPALFRAAAAVERLLPPLPRPPAFT
jgi:amidase